MEAAAAALPAAAPRGGKRPPPGSPLGHVVAAVEGLLAPRFHRTLHCTLCVVQVRPSPPTALADPAPLPPLPDARACSRRCPPPPPGLTRALLRAQSLFNRLGSVALAYPLLAPLLEKLAALHPLRADLSPGAQARSTRPRPRGARPPGAEAGP